MLNALDDIKVKFISDAEYIDQNGLIKYLPEDVKSINYKVIVSNKDEERVLEFTSLVH